MLKILRRIEKVHLADWLATRSFPIDKWDSLDIVYEEPFVERLYRTYELYGETYRVCLHIIHRCEGKPLMHPHPWPSAVKILQGSYEQTRGILVDKGERIAETGQEILHAGCEYSIIHPAETHSVNPRTDEVLTLMVMGPTYPKDAICFQGPYARDARPPRTLSTIPDNRKQDIIDKFRATFQNEKYAQNLLRPLASMIGESK